MLVHLSSKDVIHSFGLYEMRVKQDAIPGLDIPVWFIPTHDANARRSASDFDYEITCSQLCGLGHFRMRGFVTVQSEADYQTWMADQVKALAPAAAPPNTAGQAGQAAGVAEQSYAASGLPVPTANPQHRIDARSVLDLLSTCL